MGLPSSLGLWVSLGRSLKNQAMYNLPPGILPRDPIIAYLSPAQLPCRIRPISTITAKDKLVLTSPQLGLPLFLSKAARWLSTSTFVTPILIAISFGYLSASSLNGSSDFQATVPKPMTERITAWFGPLGLIISM